MILLDIVIVVHDNKAGNPITRSIVFLFRKGSRKGVGHENMSSSCKWKIRGIIAEAFHDRTVRGTISECYCSTGYDDDIDIHW